MNIKDLKYLVALAEHKHFGKAAEKCFVSQPALSMQIQKLEELLGIKLIERSNKSVLITESGLNIVKRAQDILNQVEAVHELARSAKDPYAGELKIGIFPTLAPYLLPLIIPALVKKFSKLSFYLLEEKTAVLIDQLKLGKIHAAFLALPLAEKQLTTTHLFDEEFLLAVPKTHELAKAKIIMQKDLENKKLLLLEEGHCMREQALSFCQQLQATETQDFRATSLETLRHMVAAGVGMTLMPKFACHSAKNLAYIPFQSPKPLRSICLAWRNTSAKQALLNEVSQEIISTVKTNA
jgi:LysR family hydrogen peroxide-inducible transcriptional activator